jgi:hypothetical protein
MGFRETELFLWIAFHPKKQDAPVEGRREEQVGIPDFGSRA